MKFWWLRSCATLGIFFVALAHTGKKPLCRFSYGFFTHWGAWITRSPCLQWVYGQPKLVAGLSGRYR